MQFDRTLIDKNGTPSAEELKEYFRNNDYTTAKSTFNSNRANQRLLSLYTKAKGFFKEKWLSVQKSMGGKGFFEKIFRQLSSALFLEQMMGLMMQSQSVPENRDKIDFDRKWDHIRTKLGKPLSLDELAVSDPSALENERSMFDSSDDEYEALENQFLDTLNGADREIYLMRKQGLTQKEIAERLGYKSHSAVTKRMEKMKKALIDFCADFNN